MHAMRLQQQLKARRDKLQADVCCRLLMPCSSLQGRQKVCSCTCSHFVSITAVQE